MAWLVLALLPAPAWAQASDGFVAPDLIMSADTLQKRLHDPALRILDVRRLQDYRKSHIPNAVSLPYDSVQDPNSRIQGKRFDDQRLAIKFAHAGVAKDTQVVVYDEKGGNRAARVAWLLLYLGHEKVSVLDGSFLRWQTERRRVDRVVSEPKHEVFPIDVKPHYEATASFILEHLNDPNTVIVDVRTAESYAKAHIPRAINLDWRHNLTHGTERLWKKPAELRALYEPRGITKDKIIVVHCDVADMNHHTFITLKALGYPHVRSYDRSWSEWGPDPNLPKVDSDGKTVLVSAPMHDDDHDDPKPGAAPKAAPRKP
ncbi:MAG TPA: sulfurtransferase [Methylomirabilota bacterium]|jgi:thiosulfate/3-mercaptopyruvate sulfurtransferase|nr:sulfurtransferase [Methylomirabilota bacterium]